MVFLRDDFYANDLAFTIEDKVRLGREAMQRFTKGFVADIIILAALVGAFLLGASGVRQFLGLPRAAWWTICGAVVTSVVVFIRVPLGCPGCGRSLGGRNYYARACVRCGVPLTYFTWRRMKAQLRATEDQGRLTTG